LLTHHYSFNTFHTKVFSIFPMILELGVAPANLKSTESILISYGGYPGRGDRLGRCRTSSGCILSNLGQTSTWKVENLSFNEPAGRSIHSLQLIRKLRTTLHGPQLGLELDRRLWTLQIVISEGLDHCDDRGHYGNGS